MTRHTLVENCRRVSAGTALFLATVLLSACGENATQDSENDSNATVVADAVSSTDVTIQDTQPEPVDPVPPSPGDLLIEEFYYSGAAPEGGTDHYFSDQFIELVNAAKVPLDVSGVMVGNVYGSAGAINPGMQPNSFAAIYPESIVFSSLWRIPEGTRLEPGKSLVIAHDGTNHRPFSTVELSSADFETYVTSGKDDDHPTVPNMESVVYNGGYDWLITVFGPSVAVIAAGTELASEMGAFGESLPVAPASSVLDAIETLMDGNSEAFKRLPASVDSGFAWVSGPYVGESLHRVETEDGWQDTNDSGADFVVGAPDPGKAPVPAGVFGEPDVELGTGLFTFESLTDGDSVELVAGIQGGWHIDASVRLEGFGPGGILLLYEAVDMTGKPISYQTQALLSDKGVLVDGDGWIRIGDRVVMDIGDPSEVVNQEVFVRVTAELGGQTWSDERRIIVVDEI